MMKSDYQIATEVLSGLWGNGQERRSRLTEAGYNYDRIQSIVNSLVKDGYVPGIGSSGDPEPIPEPELLTVDFDPVKYKGLEINIII